VHYFREFLQDPVHNSNFFKKNSFILCRWWSRYTARRLQFKRSTLDSLQGFWDHSLNTRHLGFFKQDNWWAWTTCKNHWQELAAVQVWECDHLQLGVWGWNRTRCGWYPVEAWYITCMDWSLHIFQLCRWLDWHHSAILLCHCFKVKYLMMMNLWISEMVCALKQFMSSFLGSSRAQELYNNLCTYHLHHHHRRRHRLLQIDLLVCCDYNFASFTLFAAVYWNLWIWSDAISSNTIRQCWLVQAQSM